MTKLPEHSKPYKVPVDDTLKTSSYYKVLPTLEDILSSFGMYSRWYGFDEAMNTKGKHTSSTPTEAIEEAKSAIQRLFAAERLDELKSIEYTELDDLVGTEVVLRSRIDNRAAELQQQIEGR